MNGKIVFIGAGSMAEAMISGMLQRGFTSPENIHVINKSNKERLEHLKTQFHVHCHDHMEKALNNAQVIILCVKPKDITDALRSLQPCILPQQLLISVVAGISTDFISRILMCETPVVRAMPNTSAAIGLSATAIAGGQYATEENLMWAKTLFQTIGTVSIVQENDLHAVTGLSGSGPAYIYYLVEAMELAASDIGLDRSTAKDLIIQTLAGTAEMLKVSKVDTSVLREKVASPGGTTQAGLETLKKYHYQEALIACIRRATDRSIELGSAYEDHI